MPPFVNKTVNKGSPFKNCSRSQWIIFCEFHRFAALFTIGVIRDWRKIGSEELNSTDFSILER